MNKENVRSVYRPPQAQRFVVSPHLKVLSGASLVYHDDLPLEDIEDEGEL